MILTSAVVEVSRNGVVQILGLLNKYHHDMIYDDDEDIMPSADRFVLGSNKTAVVLDLSQ